MIQSILPFIVLTLMLSGGFALADSLTITSCIIKCEELTAKKIVTLYWAALGRRRHMNALDILYLISTVVNKLEQKASVMQQAVIGWVLTQITHPRECVQVKEHFGILII